MELHVYLWVAFQPDPIMIESSDPYQPVRFSQSKPNPVLGGLGWGRFSWAGISCLGTKWVNQHTAHSRLGNKPSWEQEVAGGSRKPSKTHPGCHVRMQVVAGGSRFKCCHPTIDHPQATRRLVSSWVGDHQRIPAVVCFFFSFLFIFTS